MRWLSFKPWMAAFAACLILLLFFSPWIFHANQYLFASGGDAVKNYYTMAWYLAHDSGWWTIGMNYPYGEHIFFTDNQPIFSMLFAACSPITGNPALYTPGIINLLMFLSLPLCAIFLFTILRHFEIPSSWALITSLIITFLNPQFPRFFAHYSLAHAFIIPMIWWLAIKATNDKRPILYAGMLLFALSFSGMIHLYFLAIGASFTLIYSLAVWLLKPKVNKNSILALLMASVLSLLLLKILMLITDPVADRSISPYGFIDFRHIPATLLFKPGSAAIKAFRITAPSIENRTYLGIVVAIMGMIGLIMLLFNIVKKKQHKLKTENPVMAASIIAALVLLLFAMALPFKWFPALLDQFPFVNQFRASGRFAWPVYYVMAVYAVVLFRKFYLILVNANLKSFAIGLFTLFLSIWGIEAFINLRNVNNKMPQTKTNFLADDFSNILNENKLRADEFQSILPLPYYNIGSEKLYISNSNHAIYESCRASLALGLPIITTHLARTSISQSFREAQLLSGPMIRKTLLDDLPNTKPILVLSCSTVLKPSEQSIINRSVWIGNSGDLNLYVLPIDSLYDRIDEIKQSSKSRIDSLVSINHILLNDSPKILVYKHFDHTGYQDFTFAGQGALYQDKGKLILLDTILHVASYPSDIEASFWIHPHPKRPAFPIVHGQLWNAAGAPIADQYINPKESVEIYGEWVRVSMPVNCYEPGMHFKLEVIGDKAIIDEFLLKRNSASVWYQDLNRLFYNNYPM